MAKKQTPKKQTVAAAEAEAAKKTAAPKAVKSVKAKKTAEAAVEPAPTPTAEAKAAKVININTAGLADRPRLKKGAVLRADGLEEGGVDAVLVDLVKQPGGALHSALCKLVGWKKCDRRLTRAAQIAGIKLKAIREGGDIHFEVA